MSEEHAKEIGIPVGHTLKKTLSETSVRKGKDTDIYYYDHLDENGHLVSKYVVKDSTSTYPPFNNTINWEKVS